MRMNNVEIKGVPSKKDENLFDIAIRIGSVLHCPLRKEDINMITSVPTYQKDAPNYVIHQPLRKRGLRSCYEKT